MAQPTETVLQCYAVCQLKTGAKQEHARTHTHAQTPKCGISHISISIQSHHLTHGSTRIQTRGGAEREEGGGSGEGATKWVKN